MTQHDQIARQAPDSIRSEVFSHRMRGLDEEEVRDFLELLAGQIEAADAETARLRAEIEDLRNQNRILRLELDAGPTEITPRAAALFNHAQLVADQLVEEAVVHARDLMMAARMQQRDILESARRAAGATAGLGSQRL
ncbi:MULTISPECIES: DivIVA domain-containing protein [unclassified Nocardioides]|uniref:DivIVA domain-containing protein n=1 Tax=unclassified Nocardioides TaxID=2615069 RepID=UPI00360987DB